jgi:mannitol/fructose-specific phosphotransferase system IIA component (Ntr-type)
MKLSSLLSPKQVILDLKGESCAHALAHMVDHLVSRGILDSSLRDEVLSLLEQREAQVSTGIGSGVAIPHAFSDSIDHVIAAFGRSSEGVDFEAIDNAPVNLVMLLIVPEAQHNMHLRSTTCICRLWRLLPKCFIIVLFVSSFMMPKRQRMFWLFLIQILPASAREEKTSGAVQSAG